MVALFVWVGQKAAKSWGVWQNLKWLDKVEAAVILLSLAAAVAVCVRSVLLAFRSAPPRIAEPQKQENTPSKDRPTVWPVRYADSADRSREGLYLHNHGTAAGSVHVAPVQLLDGWIIYFDDTINYLESDGFLVSRTSRGEGINNIRLKTVWNLLRSKIEPPSAFPLEISYRDFNGAGYHSDCILERDTKSPSGFSVRIK